MVIMKLPKINGAVVNSVTYSAQGAIKKLVIETTVDHFDLSGLEFDANAEITVNRIVVWGHEGLA